MKNLLLIFILSFSSSIIKAQDTLTMRSGEIIIVKIIVKFNTGKSQTVVHLFS